MGALFKSKGDKGPSKLQNLLGMRLLDDLNSKYQDLTDRLYKEELKKDNEDQGDIGTFFEEDDAEDEEDEENLNEDSADEK